MNPARTLRGLVVSDFNVEPLANYLKFDPGWPSLEIEVAPFGQLSQTLLDESSEYWRAPLDFALVWTRPEAVLPSVREAMAGGEYDPAALEGEVESFAGLLRVAVAKAASVFLPSWTLPPDHLGHGMLDLAPRFGLARAVLEANLHLVKKLEAVPNVVALEAGRWLQLVGEKAYNPRLWHGAKIPFSNEVYKGAATQIKSALRGLHGRARKVIVLDLDDLLWGGVVGDAGWENLVLGGHDPVGEALVEFQQDLKALARRGIILAICSKNEEAVALEAIAKHPAMVLRPADFAGWRINWKDKAENIASLAAELNLGLDSLVFLDDNPFERARVRETLPDVLVPEWPVDKRLYGPALRRLDCFDKPTISLEDRQRAALYRTERERTASKAQVSTVDDWLRTLGLKVQAEPLAPGNLARAAQLFNKTNQMNLSTRRMTDEELWDWAQRAGCHLWVFTVSDRFGDSGLTGILGLESVQGEARVTDFILSCRVMGRKVEETLLHFAVGWARANNLGAVTARYLPTAKNKPCLEFLQRSGMTAGEAETFRWDAARSYPLHPAVELSGGGEKFTAAAGPVRAEALAV